MTKKILYVDQGTDSNGDAIEPGDMIYSACLKTAGFDVDMVDNYKDALDKLFDNNYKGVVIGNLEIAEKEKGERKISNGITLAEVIKSETYIPVIAWIPDNHFNINRKFKSKGIPFFTKGLSKPFKYINTARELFK